MKAFLINVAMATLSVTVAVILLDASKAEAAIFAMLWMIFLKVDRK